MYALSVRPVSAPAPRQPRLDLYFLGAVLVFANLPLLHGQVAEHWILLPDRVAAGEWWRLVTHPFVHVSAYHLLLDGLAFFWLYPEIGGRSTSRRLVYLAATAAGSAAAVWLGSPELRELGLCGLSGVDHGLMAAYGLELWHAGETGRQRLLGVGIAAGVVGKALLEVYLGQPLLGTLHAGDVGVPLVACHLGGALAGSAVFAGRTLLASRKSPTLRPH